jgi:hypothetical protein
MTATTATVTLRKGAGFNISPSEFSVDDNKPRFKVGYITADETVDNGDTITVDIFANWRMTKFLGIVGFIHTTKDSVIVEEQPTTVVQGTSLTITVGGSTANKKRFFVIYGA